MIKIGKGVGNLNFDALALKKNLLTKLNTMLGCALTILRAKYLIYQGQSI